MQFTILGCWGGFSYEDAGTTAFLLESNGYHLLLDCGSQALTSLEHYLDPLKLDSVILSHYHHDHIADLGVLQYYRQLFPAKEEKTVLPIYGHPFDEEHFNALTLKGVSKGIPYDPNETLEIGPFAITFLKTIHPVTCYAMRIVEKSTGKVLTFTGDSGYLNELIPFAKDSDVFLADTYLFKGIRNHHAHLTSEEAGEIALQAKVKKLVLTHLPQVGDLTELQQEAEEACKRQCSVVLAHKNLKIKI